MSDEEPKVDDLVDLLSCGALDAAVNWWADQLLGVPKHDAGDGMIDAAAGVATDIVLKDDPIGQRHVREFRWALRAALAASLWPHWFPKKADFGSALRSVGCDYGPDATLHVALDAARIESGSLRLPIKTCMWINPDKVKVSVGYGAEHKTIWARGPITSAT